MVNGSNPNTLAMGKSKKFQNWNKRSLVEFSLTQVITLCENDVISSSDTRNFNTQFESINAITITVAILYYTSSLFRGN